MNEEKIVDLLIRDLNGRRGFKQLWDELDEEIKNELRQDWVKIVTSVFAKTETKPSVVSGSWTFMCEACEREFRGMDKDAPLSRTMLSWGTCDTCDSKKECTVSDMWISDGWRSSR